jgi:hypothetical protein
VQRGRRIERDRAADRRRGRLRERGVGERATGADAGQHGRAVAREAEFALELVRELFELGDHVVAAVVARGEPVQV